VLKYTDMNDPGLERELEELHALVKDNHRMLRAIRRGQWMSFFSTVIVWVAVLALPLFLYQRYVEPIISQISSLSGTSPTTASGLLNIPAFPDLGKMINSYTGGQ
jgi:hypothetical protein